MRHRGVVRLLFGVDYVQLDRAQTFLHLAPISFDAATFEVWGALLHGGKCVLFPGKVPSPGELGELLKKHQVTTLWLTAALFNMVINEEPQALVRCKAATDRRRSAFRATREKRTRTVTEHGDHQRLRADGKHDFYLLL